MASSESGKSPARAEYGKNPDISFIFPDDGGAVIIAEKFKLAQKSEVMKKQFTFLQNSDETIKEISITDISFDTFNQMMKFIYEGVISIDENNFVNLLYASRKYFLDDWTGGIIVGLRAFIKWHNLHDHFEILEKFQIKMVDDLMKDIMINHPTEIIDNLIDSAPHKRILEIILDSQILGCTEFQLYESIVRMLGNYQTSELRCPRMALGNLLYKIRFPIMSVIELASCGKQPSLLTAEELIDLQQWVLNKTFSNTLQFFSYTPRISPLAAKCKDCRRNCR